jgi:hypothetical protein
MVLLSLAVCYFAVVVVAVRFGVAGDVFARRRLGGRRAGAGAG